MAGGGLNEVLDALDTAMAEDYNEYVGIIVSTWEGFTGNEGQLSIVRNHILLPVMEHAKSASDDWPYGDTPDDYLDAIYGSYDPDVLERAFGETINESYDDISEVFWDAYELEQQHDFLTPNGPHSTNPPWS